MGLDINGTKFLLYAKKLGVSFEETAMIGRQEILIAADQLRSNLKQFQFELSPDETEKLLSNSEKYAESFLELLGGREIVSFDASAYENASVVHDFNLPVPDAYKNKFSVVLDGGTLEHIFNFPTAIKNCMEMVKVGGHFLAITPTNNHSGHGFYQFSPELFFRIFTPQNGFEMQQMMVFEEFGNCDWYEVTDPNAVGQRVMLINETPSMLLVIAKKIAETEIFASVPLQSDYSAIWRSDDAGSAKAAAIDSYGQRGTKFDHFAFRVAKHLQQIFNRKFGDLNRREYFKKVDLNGKK